MRRQTNRSLRAGLERQVAGADCLVRRRPRRQVGKGKRPMQARIRPLSRRAAMSQSLTASSRACLAGCLRGRGHHANDPAIARAEKGKAKAAVTGHHPRQRLVMCQGLLARRILPSQRRRRKVLGPGIPSGSGDVRGDARQAGQDGEAKECDDLLLRRDTDQRRCRPRPSRVELRPGGGVRRRQGPETLLTTVVDTGV